MIYVLTALHLLVCLFLVIVVLLQSGKAADLAGAFGGMGSQTAFGPRGAATVLSKATTIAAGLFMVTSLSLGILTSRNVGGGTKISDELDRLGKPAATTQPAAPAKPTEQPSIELIPEGGGASRKIPIQVPQNPNAPAPAPAK